MKNLLLAKTFAVLDAVSGADGELPFRELAARLEIPSPTLSRIVSDLIEQGMIEKRGRGRLVPACGMLRLGQRAYRNSPLCRAAAPLLRDRAAKLEVGAAFSAFQQDELVLLCRIGEPAPGADAVSPEFLPWRSGSALVILASRGDRKNAEEWMQKVIDRGRFGLSRELELFRNRFDEAAAHGYLLMREVGREFSVTFPVGHGENCHAVEFFGAAPERRNFDKLTLECSLLASRLGALVRQE